MTFRITALSATALALALACAAPPLPEEPPVQVSPLVLGAGDVLAVQQVAVITDASGTMYARKTFPAAKALTRSFVAGMPNGSYRAGAVGFGGTDRMTVPVAPLDRSALGVHADALRILGDIDGRGGATPMHRVFGEVQRDVGGTGGKLAVVLFSDGLADRPAWTLDAATALAASLNGNLCIHTVQTGDDPVGAELLAQLTALTPCGSNRTADSIRTPTAYNAFLRDVFVAPGSGAGRSDTGMETGMQSGGGAIGGDRCGDTLRLRGVEFDFDKSAIRPDAAPVLDVAAQLLRECPNVSVNIDGHTDWTGTEEYNDGLSMRRAEAVKRYLLSAGVSASRLNTRGFGELQPIASNQTREGRARNRRVELQPIR